MNIKSLFFVIVMMASGVWAVAQETVPVSGGSVTGTDGSFSFTLGQVFAQSDLEPAVSANIVTASVIEGVQQPFTIDQLSIAETKALNEKVTLYPNPTKRTVIVEMENGEKEVQYRLFGMEGRLLQSGSMRERVSLDLSDYPTGTYLLYLEGENNNKNVYRIIKVN